LIVVGPVDRDKPIHYVTNRVVSKFTIKLIATTKGLNALAIKKFSFNNIKKRGVRP
jgi:hypothetical protein